VPPLDGGSDSAGTEPRRERPRQKPAKPAPRAPTGSFTSRFRVSVSPARSGGAERSERGSSRPTTWTRSCRRFVRKNDARCGGTAASESLMSAGPCAYAAVMYATAIVGGKVVRFKLSPALARAHRRNRGRTMTDVEAVALVETRRRAQALRSAKPCHPRSFLTAAFCRTRSAVAPAQHSPGAVGRVKGPLRRSAPLTRPARSR
jgi:hypothetical protein